MKKVLQRLANANAELHKEEKECMALMNETLDTYNAKKISKKEMKKLMTETSKLWMNIIKEVEHSDTLLAKYKQS